MSRYYKILSMNVYEKNWTSTTTIERKIKETSLRQFAQVRPRQTAVTIQKIQSIESQLLGTYDGNKKEKRMI